MVVRKLPKYIGLIMLITSIVIGWRLLVQRDTATVMNVLQKETSQERFTSANGNPQVPSEVGSGDLADYSNLATFNDDVSSCAQNQKYVAVVQDAGQREGELNVYVKEHDSEFIYCSEPDGEPIFTLNLEVTYPEYLIGNFIIVDSGTGPTGRMISAYDVTRGEIVFSEVYGGMVSVTDETNFSYWRSSNTEPTMYNCENLQEIEKNGFAPEIHELVIRNLLSGEVSRGEIRCVATQ